MQDLGAKLGCFAIISDTHINPDEEICNSPFPVNRRANRRLRHVVRELNNQPVKFVVHLGDLLHPVPESGPPYAEAAEAYRDIVSELKVPIHVLPGNHDIGDTPIKGGPASPATDASIAVWTAEFGDQYKAFDAFGIRFLLINAQLINSGLKDEVRQRIWLEAELAAHRGGRVMLFLHHPIYLMRPDERNHYDNTDQPGRGWLLSLFEQNGVEAVFAGHAHNFWYDRVFDTDYYLAPATSFVRQDYSEMLRAAPPEGSEAGRDDRAKLGYFLVTVYEKGHTLRVVRTDGKERATSVAEETIFPALQAPDPRGSSRPVLGFDLRQNWAELTEVPPSGGLDEFDRKTVRNDYPLLALQEMGVRHVRIPLHDLLDARRRARLAAFHHLGFNVTLFTYGLPEAESISLITEMAPYLSDWEITIDWPDLDKLAMRLLAARSETGLPLYLSRMRTKDDIRADGTYFHVINHGFSPSDMDKLDRLAALGLDGAVYRLGAQDDVVETLLAVEDASRRTGLKGSIHLRMGGDNPALPWVDEDVTAHRLVQAALTGASLNHSRIVADTLISVDRGYFVRTGVIDRCCNPTSLLDIVKILHAHLAMADSRPDIIENNPLTWRLDGVIFTLKDGQIGRRDI